jgi:diguanylate cyclase (GGDEF)-like protein
MLDPLTELANRRSFDSFLKSNISAARLAQVNLSLALIDIDQFKAVNDMMGHAYGDSCLKEIAAALNANLRRKTDFVARLGGEEFAIILPNSDAESSLNLCEVLRQSILDKRIDHPGHEAGKHLTVSIGIAVWDPLSHAPCDPDLLLQLADDCLYEAKRRGRNRVVCRSLSCPSGISA